MSTRQAASIAKIRSERRAQKLCAGCAVASATYWCGVCRPRKTAKEVSEARRKAVMVRWQRYEKQAR